LAYDIPRGTQLGPTYCLERRSKKGIKGPLAEVVVVARHHPKIQTIGPLESSKSNDFLRSHISLYVAPKEGFRRKVYLLCWLLFINFVGVLDSIMARQGVSVFQPHGDDFATKGFIHVIDGFDRWRP
jgi:hypothetical protein